MSEHRTFLTVLSASLVAVAAGALLATCHILLNADMSVSHRDDVERRVVRRFQLFDAENLTTTATMVASNETPRCSRLELFSHVLHGADRGHGIYELRRPYSVSFAVNSHQPGTAGQCRRVPVWRFG